MGEVVGELMASMLVTGTSGCWMNTSGEVGTLSVGDQIREGENVTQVQRYRHAEQVLKLVS